MLYPCRDVFLNSPLLNLKLSTPPPLTMCITPFNCKWHTNHLNTISSGLSSEENSNPDPPKIIELMKHFCQICYLHSFLTIDTYVIKIVRAVYF